MQENISEEFCEIINMAAAPVWTESLSVVSTNSLNLSCNCCDLGSNFYPSAPKSILSSILSGWSLSPSFQVLHIVFILTCLCFLCNHLLKWFFLKSFVFAANTTSVLKGRLDMKSKQVGRGNKRPAVTPGRGGRRNKRSRVGDDDSFLLEGEENADSQHMSPDSNMSLKYTYGVYAWRQWVLQKNAQLEKVSKSGTGRLKLFKTNLLQCTPDELNYSLCLFVKEVRKPNKEEYSPDSILYLCLGKFLYSTPASLGLWC